MIGNDINKKVNSRVRIYALTQLIWKEFLFAFGTRTHGELLTSKSGSFFSFDK